MSKLQDRTIFTESAPTSNPPSGIAYVYTDTDGKLKKRRSDGTIVTIPDIASDGTIRDGAGNNVAIKAYFGGTAAANLLDDYEEGSWTPTDQSGAGLTFTVEGTPKYIKVGDKVTVWARFNWPSTADSSSTLVGGLPFPIANNGSVRGSGGVFTNSASATIIAGNTNASTFRFYADGTLTASDNSDLSQNTVIFTLTYRTA